MVERGEYLQQSAQRIRPIHPVPRKTRLLWDPSKSESCPRARLFWKVNVKMTLKTFTFFNKNGGSWCAIKISKSRLLLDIKGETEWTAAHSS
jgi:hypothetical protein